jgi:prepilin peptidase CpaA
MLGQLLVLAVLPALLIAAAATDIASFTIPNSISLALIGAFAAFALAERLTAGAIGTHLLAGGVGLLAGFTLFALGYIGGGDAKFFAAIVLWLGIGDFAQYALLSAIAGGALTLCLLSLRKLPLPSVLASKAWIQRLHDQNSGIPYGVALAAGVFVVLPHTEIFRLAAA